jgi:hypothetical protein
VDRRSAIGRGPAAGPPQDRRAGLDADDVPKGDAPAGAARAVDRRPADQRSGREDPQVAGAAPAVEEDALDAGALGGRGPVPVGRDHPADGQEQVGPAARDDAAPEGARHPDGGVAAGEGAARAQPQGDGRLGGRAAARGRGRGPGDEREERDAGARGPQGGSPPHPTGPRRQAQLDTSRDLGSDKTPEVE